MRIDEGDQVLLHAKVYRANSEQALIEFTSKEGPFSVRVPLDQLVSTKDLLARFAEWSAECERTMYTDTGIAWEFLEEMAAALQPKEIS